MSTHTELITLDGDDWTSPHWLLDVTQRIHALEAGNILFFPQLAFALSDEERALLDPSLADQKRKNISLDTDGTLHGLLHSTPSQSACCKAMILRYQQSANTLVSRLFPSYVGKLRAAPTSLRLHRVEHREQSWRQDDARLHIDAFPSRPNHGERILRVFTNIASGSPRVWRVGERFETIAKQFLPQTRALLPGVAWLMHRLGITKRRRTPYDQLMLQLHDAMKRDDHYQQHGMQQTIAFPAGCVWICYSDQVAHAVMSGQFMMEQTYFLAPENMSYPDYAPLSVLQRLCRKKLIA